MRRPATTRQTPASRQRSQLAQPVVDPARVAALVDRLLAQPGLTIDTTSVEECAAVLAEVKRRGGSHHLIENFHENAKFNFGVSS